MRPDEAHAFLGALGPKDRLSKVRAALEAIEPICGTPGDELAPGNFRWDGVMDALSGAESPGTREERQDARETLHEAISELVRQIREDWEWLQHDVIARYTALGVAGGVTGPAGGSATPAVTARVCACGCGQPVSSPRPEAKYATGACRVRALRRRQD